MFFVPLVNRSAFTFYSGAMSVEQLVCVCAERGYNAAGLCDRNGLYAAVRFYKAAKRVGLKAVLGAEITGDGSREQGAGRRKNTGGSVGSACRSPLPAPLFVFAKTNEGYARLCHLITRRNLELDRFDRTAECSAATAGGHVALVASDVALLYALKNSGAAQGSLFARLSGDIKADGDACAAADWLKLPIVAAPMASFVDPSGYAVHRVLRAAKHLKPEAGPTDYLLSPAEAERRFAGVGSPTRGAGALACDMSGELAASCDVTLPLGDWLLPSAPVGAGETEAGKLRALSYAGLAKRVRNVTAAYLSRLERELDVIVRLGFAGYFLVVEDIARFARDQGIPNIGRGSGASSLVSYCLFMTHVDPVAEGLYFERFLNPGRRNPPDIDLDFSWRERDHVIRHVYDTYGDGNVCMIATHNTFSARSGFREVGKAMGVPEEETGVIARAIPHTSFEHFAEALASRPESRRAPLKDRPWQDLLDMARRIDGFPRHLSVHCGGVVVSPIPLTQRLSLERAAKGVAITQCDMVDVEDLGLVKIDLLGNRSLGVLAGAVASVKDHTGQEPPIFPPERTYGDAETNALISEGRSMGCFYIESPGMRLLLQRLRTRTFRDLTAVSSIIRPGVSESGMMEAYISRRLGEEPAKYAAPGLEPILRETFGVMVYQEDVIRVAHEFVGLSLSEADLLRRAMSGKYRSRAEMELLTDSFFVKGRERSIGEGVLAELWAQIRSFAGYAFCKAHSASFAQLSYQVAYLKAHYPAEFFAALVNNQGGFYGTAAYVEEARRWGMDILPPDVNSSEDDFAGKGRLLRCGFFTLRGLRPGALDAVYEERGEGPYRSFADLCSRLRNRLWPAEIENLIRAGACDSFGASRGVLLEQLRQAGGSSKPSEHSGIRKAESGSFWESGNVEMRASRFRTPNAECRISPYLSLAELLTGEVRTLGYAVTAHPLTPMLDWAAGNGYTHAGDLPAKARGTGSGTARVWGQVITYKRIPTRKTGEAMAFATLEDPTGLMELVFFPKTYTRFGELITRGRPLVVEGRVEDNRGGLALTVERAWAVRGVVVPKPAREAGAEEGAA